MVKRITVILLVIILFSIGFYVCYANSNVYIEAESKTVDANEFSVKLKMDNVDKNNPLAGIKLDLFYDNDLLEVTGVKKIKGAGSSVDLHENYANEGRLRICLISVLGISNSGEFYEISFWVINNDKIDNQTELKIDVKEISDKEGNVIDADTKSGIIEFNDVQGINQKEYKITINIDEKKDDLDELEESDLDEDLDLSLNDINKSNINYYINNKKNNLDLNTKLSYKVENEEILTIEEDGEITVPTRKDNTNDLFLSWGGIFTFFKDNFLFTIGIWEKGFNLLLICNWRSFFSFFNTDIINSVS